jgi:hypothetical protein
LRLIVAQAPYMNESDGTRYNLTGPDYAFTVHTSLAEAMQVAEASF